MELQFFTVGVQRRYSDTFPQQSWCCKWMGLGTQDDRSEKLRLHVSRHK